MAAKWEVGQRVYVAQTHRKQRTTCWGTVTKVGRKYFAVKTDPGSNGMTTYEFDKFQIDSGRASDPNWPADAYPSIEAFEAAQVAERKRIAIRDWGSRSPWARLSDDDVTRLHALLVEIGAITEEVD